VCVCVCVCVCVLMYVICRVTCSLAGYILVQGGGSGTLVYISAVIFLISVYILDMSYMKKSSACMRMHALDQQFIAFAITRSHDR
jgi:hypothetical protein